MRTENEIFKLIIDTAAEDERIRAAVLVGSRANPECPKDEYMDFDVTYYVDELAPFYNNLPYIERRFGKAAFAQLPELMTHPLLPPENAGSFVYLVIFDDGRRIDFTFDTKPFVNDGEPAVALLDKDARLPEIKVDPAYFYVKPPKKSDYENACNEFWWCLNNVAKGIARDELPYAKHMFERYVREMLDEVVCWYIGVLTDFSVSAGKMGKYFKRRLPKDVYESYEKTYSDADRGNFRRAVYEACGLFSFLAKRVGESLGFVYNEDEEKNMREYLERVM